MLFKNALSKKWSLLLSGFLSLAVIHSAVAGKYNPVIEIGMPAPVFTNLPATDGKTYSSDDFNQATALVVAFMCNSCPYATDYEQRLAELTQQYGEKVAVIAINCNLVSADSLEEMTKRVESEKLPYRYLLDQSQQSARQFGALRTPEFFVLNKSRHIVYTGAFDDNTDASLVQQKYVAAAVDSVLNGTTLKVTETPPIGCLIRMKRTRSRD